MNKKTKKSKPKKQTKSRKTPNTLLANPVTTDYNSDLSRIELLELELAKARQVLKSQDKKLKSQDKIIEKQKTINEALRKVATILKAKS